MPRPTTDNFFTPPPAIEGDFCPIHTAQLRIDSYRAETERTVTALKTALHFIVVPLLSVLGMATVITVAALH